MQPARKLRKYLAITGISIQNRLMYKASFLGEFFFYAFVIFLMTRLWGVIYISKPAFMGFSFNQIIWYITLTEFLTLTSVKIFFTFARDIKEGNVTYQMLRPYQFIFYHLADSTGTILVKIFFNGLLGMLLAWLFAGPLQGFTPQRLPLLLILYVNSFLLNFFLQTCLGLTAFWLEDNTALYWIYSKLALILGVLLPLDIYPAWMQRFLSFLPFPYLYYGPARLTIAFSQAKWLEIFTGQLAYLVLAAGLSFLIFSRGKRKVVLNGG